MTEPVPDDLALPAALAEVFAIGFSWKWEGKTNTAHGCDFEPFDAFDDPEHTAWWFRLWTGNPEADGSDFRFFGKTGAGDYAGFWLMRPEAPVTGQPVVYLGSEGQLGIVARDLGDLLWLFAAGYGPAEAAGDRGTVLEPSEAFTAIAQRYAPGRERPAAQIIAAAQAEFPRLSDYIDGLCQ